MSRVFWMVASTVVGLSGAVWAGCVGSDDEASGGEPRQADTGGEGRTSLEVVAVAPPSMLERAPRATAPTRPTASTWLQVELPAGMPRPPQVVPPMPLPRLPDPSTEARRAEDANRASPVAPVVHQPRVPGGDERVRSPSLPDHGGMARDNSCNIVGADDRSEVGSTSIYPFSTISHLAIRFGNEWHGCSAVILRKNFALTAGHCLYDISINAWADEVVVVPGLDDTYQPFGQTFSDKFYSVIGWTQQHDVNYDIGAVRLATALGVATGTLGYGAFSDAELQAWSMNTAGYPYDHPNRMIRAYSPTDSVLSSLICSQLDTCSGQSGSGCWAYFSSNNERYVTSVMHGYGGPCGGDSVLVRITNPLYDWMQGIYAECSCTSGECCDGCSYLSSATLCRPAADMCDVPEFCTGASPTCPGDAVLPSGIMCRPPLGECDIPEYCDGLTATCPSDGVLPAGLLCRPAFGNCDVAEHCDGLSSICPPDAVLPKSTVCRPMAGECDIEERCSGFSASCPPDASLPNTTTCREAAGPCDVAEHCSGSSATCPPDAVLPKSTVCRPAAGECDIEETCSGGSVSCPSDALLPNTKVCREAAGSCDVVEYCSGSSAICPADEAMPECMDPGPSGDPSADSGCHCSNAGASSGSNAAVWLGLALAGLATSRRRRRAAPDVE